MPAPDGSRQLLLEARARGVRPAAARAARGSRSPTRRSATPTSRCSPPGCAPATCSRSAGHVARTTPELWSLEAWGGATYDVALRFLAEDPWERLAALRQAVPNICLQMLLRGRNTVGYTPYPTEVTDAFVEEAAATGIDVFRIFDALNDVEQMRPAIEAVRATGTRRRRGGALLHRRPVGPGRAALHARLLPRPGRADRRRRRARAGDQGHGRAAARARGAHPGDRAARPVRPAGAPAHPRHRRRPAGDAAGRDRRRGGRRRRRDRLDGRHHLAAAALRAGLRDRPLRRARPGCRWPRSARWSRTGRPPAGSTRRSSPGCPRRPGGSTPTRSPAGSSPTCASRRSRWGSARSSSRSRTCTPRRTTSSATSSR